MTIRELNRVYRQAGIPSPFRPGWLAPLALGLYLGFLPGAGHRAGNLYGLLPFLMFCPFAALAAAAFWPRAFSPARHAMAWTHGPPRWSLALANVLSIAAAAAIAGASAGLTSRALVLSRWNPPEWTTRSLLGDVLLLTSIALALTGWVLTFAGTISSRLVPVQYRFLRSAPEEASRSMDWIDLLWRIPVALTILGAIHAPLIYGLTMLGVTWGSFLIAAVAFPTAFTLLVTSECGAERPWMALTAPRKVRRQALARSSAPLRALFWTQDPVTTSTVVIFTLGLAALLPTLSRIWEISFSGLIPYLPCFINVAWILYGYPVSRDRGKSAALYAWGLDLRRQARIRFWSFLAGSAATTLLGLCLTLAWGKGTSPDNAFLAISVWSAQVIFFVPRFGCLLFSVLWILLVFLPGLREPDPHPGPTAALLLALAAVLLLLRAWRASEDESALKAAAFDPWAVTSPAPWAGVFRGRGSRRAASRRARPPSPGG